MVRGNFDVKIKSHPVRQCLNLMTVPGGGNFLYLLWSFFDCTCF